MMDNNVIAFNFILIYLLQLIAYTGSAPNFVAL